jgi:hypothetical protein
MVSNVRAHRCAHSCDEGDVLPPGVTDLGRSSRLSTRALTLMLVGAARTITEFCQSLHSLPNRQVRVYCDCKFSEVT